MRWRGCYLESTRGRCKPTSRRRWWRWWWWWHAWSSLFGTGHIYLYGSNTHTPANNTEAGSCWPRLFSMPSVHGPCTSGVPVHRAPSPSSGKQQLGRRPPAVGYEEPAICILCMRWLPGCHVNTLGYCCHLCIGYDILHLERYFALNKKTP